LQDGQSKPVVITRPCGHFQFGNGISGGDTFRPVLHSGHPRPSGGRRRIARCFRQHTGRPNPRDGSGAQRGRIFRKTIAPYTWVAIVGNNLAATTRSWQAADIKDNRLPTQLDGVSVTVGGRPAYVSYISPSQVNILTPAGTSIGDVEVQVRSGALVSNIVTVRSDVVSPAFFKQSEKYILATHIDGSLVDPMKPAQPGEIVYLYGNGFGGTDPSVIEGPF
jgi:hypothetical protein